MSDEVNSHGFEMILQELVIYKLREASQASLAFVDIDGDYFEVSFWCSVTGFCPC